VLACFEEGLRHGGLAGVVGEVTRLSMPESRRLQLAAEASGTLGLALRRWRRMADAADFGQPTASVSRWRVSALPSSALPVPGVGRPRWLVELIRARAGPGAGTGTGAAGAGLVVEACDETGRLAVPATLADGPAAAGSERAAA
jgi:protein ImuA